MIKLLRLSLFLPFPLDKWSVRSALISAGLKALMSNDMMIILWRQSRNHRYATLRDYNKWAFWMNQETKITSLRVPRRAILFYRTYCGYKISISHRHLVLQPPARTFQTMKAISFHWSFELCVEAMHRCFLTAPPSSVAKRHSLWRGWMSGNVLSVKARTLNTMCERGWGSQSCSLAENATRFGFAMARAPPPSGEIERKALSLGKVVYETTSKALTSDVT